MKNRNDPSSFNFGSELIWPSESGGFHLYLANGHSILAGGVFWLIVFDLPIEYKPKVIYSIRGFKGTKSKAIHTALKILAKYFGVTYKEIELLMQEECALYALSGN